MRKVRHADGFPEYPEDQLVTIKVGVMKRYQALATELAEVLSREQPALAISIGRNKLTQQRVLQLAIHLGLDELRGGLAGKFEGGR